ncbi:MAG: ABC-type transport auxiliary lipoprotein family protein [Candidatus Acidiferrales bacterium]
MARRQIERALWVVLLTAFLSACGAPRPIKYYVLDVPTVPAQASSAQFPITLVVARPTASNLYRDDRLVYGTGPVQRGVYSDHRWAETPSDMIQDMLVSTLRSTGQFRSVSRINSTARGDYIVRSRLSALYEVDKPELVARFSLQLELFDPAARATVWSDSYTHDEPVQGKSVADVVEALNRNVDTGMKYLTAGISQYFATHPHQNPLPASH